MKRLVLAALTFALPLAAAPTQARPSTEVADSAATPMSDARFWAIIDRTAAYEADSEAQLEALHESLNALSTEDIVAFSDAFERQIQRAYTWDLWAVAYIAHGGASDDGFDYFRRWLVSKGQAVFERVLAQPDSLAEVLAPDSEGVLEFEEISAVAAEVWTRKTGRAGEEMPMPTSATLPGATPAGEPFDEDPAALAARFPRTWARFGDRPLG